jgi:K+-transporting ATPase ATPase C chain
MLAQIRPAVAMIALFSLLTGLAYPLAITGIAQLLFAETANGSMIERDGVTIGSRLIGQNFTAGRYFHGRPSATASSPYNAASSGGSNLGPTSKALVERVNAAIEAEFAAGRIDIVAADAATTSASGLDPHISPQFALAQVPAVAAARGLPEAKLRALVEERIEQRFAGFIGEPRVNVLELDLALDEMR